MLKKTASTSLIIILGMFGLILSASSCSSPEPIVIKESASHRKLSMDDKIKEATIIVIGEVTSKLPSRWDSQDGQGPETITAQSIFEADLSIFTDSLILVTETLKGDIKKQDVIRVRSFKGEIDNVIWEDDSQPALNSDQIFLLFLKENTGPTKDLDPGAYMSINGISAIYTVSDDAASSVDDTWSLSELIDYIQDSISNS
jgi:hypothetical protein